MCVCDVFLLHLFVDLIVRSLVHPTSAGYMGATKLIRLVVGRHYCSGNGFISSPFLYHHALVGLSSQRRTNMLMSFIWFYERDEDAASWWWGGRVEI